MYNESHKTNKSSDIDCFLHKHFINWYLLQKSIVFFYKKYGEKRIKK